jgi:hypothetical protein
MSLLSVNLRAIKKPPLPGPLLHKCVEERELVRKGFHPYSFTGMGLNRYRG